jgi:hypothetical protein
MSASKQEARPISFCGRRNRDIANNRKPDPRDLHNMIVEGLSMLAALKEELKLILVPKV